MLRNTNELLGKMGVDGVKTGTSTRSGQCLILYADRESEVVRNGQMKRSIRAMMVVLLGEARTDLAKAPLYCNAAGSFTTNGRLPGGLPIRKNSSDFAFANEAAHWRANQRWRLSRAQCGVARCSIWSRQGRVGSGWVSISFNS